MSTELSLGLEEGGSDDTCSAEGRLTDSSRRLYRSLTVYIIMSLMCEWSDNRSHAAAPVICIDTDREFDGLSPSVPQLRRG